MNSKREPGLQVANHFVLLVYPFLHDLSGPQRKRKLEELEGRWLHWWRRLDRDELKRTLDNTFYFLPYIRELLFPETEHLPTDDPQGHVTEADRLARSALGELAGRLHGDAVLRLTYDPERLEALKPLRLEHERRDDEGNVVEQFAARFDLCWADVVLFPQGVGFLVLKVQLQRETPAPEDVNDFLHYLRPIHPPTVDWVLAHWKRDRPDNPLTFQTRELVDFLLQGVTALPGRQEGGLEAFLSHIQHHPSTPRYTDTSEGQVYGKSFHLYTYACLGDSAQTEEDAPPPAEPGSPFGSAADRVLYELATCTDTSAEDYVPHSAQVARLMDENLIALWANWQGMALHDNVVFLGVQPTGFTLHALPRNVEGDYLLLYLLTLYQKVRLSLFHGEVIRRDRHLYRNLEEARKLCDAFLMFENHYWFSEVTYRPQGNELHRRCQHGLDVTQLREEVAAQVQKLQDYYERRHERRINGLLNLLAFVGLPAGVLAELFGNALVQKASWGQFLMTTAVVYLIVLGGWGLFWLWERQREQ